MIERINITFSSDGTGFVSISGMSKPLANLLDSMANLRPSLTGISVFSNSTSGAGAALLMGPRYGNCIPQFWSAPVDLKNDKK